MTVDPIVDRSEAQKQKWIDDVRLALCECGYSVVRAEFLQQLLDVAHEETNPVVRDRSPPATHEPG
jgi:hypothetical protein